MSNIQYKLDVPFKNFQAGQIIQSKQFNDDMFEIENKTNEIIDKHNNTNDSLNNHLADTSNPHNVTAEQVDAYDKSMVDKFIDAIKNGDLNEKSIVNFVLADECVDDRTLKNYSINPIKVSTDFGSLLNISENVEIIDRYTKQQVDDLLIQKVGEGTYSKEELDKKFSDVQVGQIIDKTIGVEKFKSDVGELIDISKNPTILNMYTNEEIDSLIFNNGLPRDWGSITEETTVSNFGFLPVANYMVADNFVSPSTPILDLDIKEVVDSRNTYSTLSARLDKIENSIVSILNMFKEVTING